MKELRLNTLHRYVGIVIAPCLVIQTLSGLLLGFGLYRDGGSLQIGKRFIESPGVWNELLVKAHFGPGLLSDVYHLLLGAGASWMAVTGWLLFLRLRRSRRRMAANNTGESRVGGATRP